MAFRGCQKQQFLAETLHSDENQDFQVSRTQKKGVQVQAAINCKRMLMSELKAIIPNGELIQELVVSNRVFPAYLTGRIGEKMAKLAICKQGKQIGLKNKNNDLNLLLW